MSLQLKELFKETEEKRKKAETQQVECVSPLLARLYRQWCGKTICIFGESGMGKTTFAIHLCKTAMKITRKPPLYVALDLNLKEDDFRHELTEFLGRNAVLFVEPWALLESVLVKWYDKFMEKYSIVVIDSVSEIWSWIIRREVRRLAWKLQHADEQKKEELFRKLAKRLDLKQEFSTYLEIIAARLKEITNAVKIPAIMIAHPTTIFDTKNKDPDLKNFWDEVGFRPAYMSKALRRVSNTYLAVLEDTTLKLIEIRVRGIFPRKLDVIKIPAKEYDYNR